MFWWPGTVPAGSKTDHISGFQDILPTALDLAGVVSINPTDGLSLVPTLRGQPENQSKHAHLYWEFLEKGGRKAVVKGDWKAVQLNTLRDPNPIELYNLKDDLHEQHNVAAEHPALVEEMAKIMQAEHVDQED